MTIKHHRSRAGGPGRRSSLCTISLSARRSKVRIIQTNSAGDNVHVIDPGDQQGGRRDQRDRGQPRRRRRAGRQPHLHQRRSGEHARHRRREDAEGHQEIPLSGHPNNMAVGKDGRRVYVGIIQAPGGVDVIDTATMTAGQDDPDEGHHPQPVRHARRQVRGRRLDRRARPST